MVESWDDLCLTNELQGILDPFPDDVLLSWVLEAHEQMVDALHLWLGDLVGDDVEAFVDLH